MYVLNNSDAQSIAKFLADEISIALDNPKRLGMLCVLLARLERAIQPAHSQSVN